MSANTLEKKHFSITHAEKMFMDFRSSRDLDTEDWDTRMNYWIGLIPDYCKHYHICTMTTNDMYKVFRNSKRPDMEFKGLPVVLKEMYSRGLIQPIQEFAAMVKKTALNRFLIWKKMYDGVPEAFTKEQNNRWVFLSIVGELENNFYVQACRLVEKHASHGRVLQIGTTEGRKKLMESQIWAEWLDSYQEKEEDSDLEGLPQKNINKIKTNKNNMRVFILQCEKKNWRIVPIYPEDLTPNSGTIPKPTSNNTSDEVKLFDTDDISEPIAFKLAE